MFEDILGDSKAKEEGTIPRPDDEDLMDFEEQYNWSYPSPQPDSGDLNVIW